MIVYVIERNNPQTWEEPQIVLNGKDALNIVREEYENKINELSEIYRSEKSMEIFEFGCYWFFDENSFTGTATIEADYLTDKWEWRITEHNI